MFRLIPRTKFSPIKLPASTLFWQTFVMMAVMLIMAIGIWVEIFRYFEQKPRATDAALRIVSVVNLTASALINAQPEKRRSLLASLAESEGVRVYPAEKSDQLHPLSETRFLNLLRNNVRQKLGENTRFASARDGLTGFWVSFRLQEDDHDDYWVMLPEEKIVVPGAIDWLGWSLIAAALSLIGAYFIATKVSSPLRLLTDATRRLGAGESPPKLPEQGAEDIIELTRAFNKMNTDLQQLDSDRRLILAGISHDLRTPLARLRLGLEMTTSADSEREAMIVDIEEMDRIIHQFVDFGRSEERDKYIAIDLIPFLAPIVADFQKRGGSFGLYADIMATVHGNPLALRRALNNLLGNAGQYAGYGKAVEIHLTRNESFAVISVLDQGPGIPDALLERIKKPFIRLDEARGNVSGSGLGLAIVDRVVNSHQGVFSLHNRPEGGLEARICLPHYKPANQ